MRWLHGQLIFYSFPFGAHFISSTNHKPNSTADPISKPFSVPQNNWQTINTQNYSLKQIQSNIRSQQGKPISLSDVNGFTHAHPSPFITNSLASVNHQHIIRRHSTVRSSAQFHWVSRKTIQQAIRDPSHAQPGQSSARKSNSQHTNSSSAHVHMNPLRSVPFPFNPVQSVDNSLSCHFNPVQNSG